MLLQSSSRCQDAEPSVSANSALAEAGSTLRGRLKSIARGAICSHNILLMAQYAATESLLHLWCNKQPHAINLWFIKQPLSIAFATVTTLLQCCCNFADIFFDLSQLRQKQFHPSVATATKSLIAMSRPCLFSPSRHREQ